MGNTKKVFKIFSITQYKQEEEYLSSMHKSGWKFTRVVFPGLYYFEKCEPENVTYRLDYNQEGIADKAEYVQLFRDCGWEYLFDFVGYSYFRKASAEVDNHEEIFCDDESRLDMMKRVYKGRIVPLIVLFFCIILPQFIMNVFGYGGGSIAQDIFSVTFLILGILYLSIFCLFTVRFHQYEKNIHPENVHVKWKYTGIYCVIAALAILLGGAVFLKFSSDVKISDCENGFTIEANRLNKTVVKEFDLKKGDIVEVTHQADAGSWYVRIGKKDETPIFYGNTYDEFEQFSVEIQEDGTYEIVCRGRNAKGYIKFDIK